MSLPPSTTEQIVRHLNAEIAAAAGSLSRPWRVKGVKGTSRAFLIWRLLTAQPRPALIVAPDAKQAETLVENLRAFFGEEESAPPFARRIHHFPDWDVGPLDDLSPTPEIVAARIEGLYHLQQTKNPIVVTTPQALLLRVPPRAAFTERLRYMVEGDEVDLDQLATQLDDWGYRRVPLVEERGDFSIRGGILDIFPPAHPQPLRIELLGDRIESIRDLDPITQRSLDPRQEFLVLPVREFDTHGRTSKAAIKAIEDRCYDLEVGRDERSQLLYGLQSNLLFPGIEFLLPYFYPSLDPLTAYLPVGTLVWLDAAGEVDAAIELAATEIAEHAAKRTEEHRFFPPVEQLFLSPAELRVGLARFPVIELEALDVLASEHADRNLLLRSYLTSDVKIERLPNRREVSFEPLAARVREWLGDRHRVVISVSGAPQVERVARLFGNHQIVVSPCDHLDDALAMPGGGPYLTVSHLSTGFRLPDERLVLLTDTDIFGEARQRRRGRRVEVAQLLKNLSELKPDDFVVHVDHGVGRYRGLKHLKVAETEGDYLHLDYAGGDRLYLPCDRINLVQKYVGADGANPPLDKLGGTSWASVKSKTRESILAMAQELLRVYAAREVHERRSFGNPDGYFQEFEAAFPFEETPDQQQAIDDVLADMQKEKPMDRLICGDVGYGKTEVALRAAFLAVLAGRQVAVLVPTTVLAQQHYNTFRKRMEGYPVRVEMLSRFQTPAEIKANVKLVSEGKVDVVIGTHRLLQKDIQFQNLGLLIVDEEHRFGVAHKERIRQMRQLVDCLTLTATPIPRTLQMALLGIRDLSVIESPPIDRLAVRTYVTRYDEGVIREAIQRELKRQGQVFFVHNRVETIEIRARRLRELVPEARFAVAHGQMHEKDLEKVMGEFFDKTVDVLVCSAIIESGIDVPSANTMIIDRADTFGLAQLYQLRGRVGRSHERAYAYLMIPGEQLITRDAQLRLQVLQELDDLGGGFRLATHDLEIRGAGNLLGKQQSGQIAAVGFELYQSMMEEAVREIRGEQTHVEIEPEIQLGIPAFIPESYIPDEDQRIVFYRRLASIRGQTDLESIAQELRDRYGPMPPTVDSFLRVMDLRRSLKDQMIVRAALRGGMVILQFHPEAPVDVDYLVELVRQGRGRFKLSTDFQLSFQPAQTDWDGLIDETKTVLRELKRS